MVGVQVTDYDRRVYEEELAGFLPDRIMDAHVHVYRESMMRYSEEERKGAVRWPTLVAPEMTLEDMHKSYRQMFPGKTVRQVLFGMPTCRLNPVNKYALACAKKDSLPVLYCTNWDTSKEELQKAMADGFCGIKPYLCNCPPYIPADEVRIFDFLPPAHMDYMNEIGGIVMLHIPRKLRLKDPVNLAQMLEINDRWPKAKVIIAHIGRAYVSQDFGDAFSVLKRAKNLYYDFTANTLDTAMEKVIEMAGTDRVLFGSDMPITKMRMYRIEQDGHYVNVVPRGLYGDVSYDKNMAESDSTEITTFMYEELRAFKRACGTLGLGRNDIEKIMCKNACKLFHYSFKGENAK